jgi:hypothetical protein
MILIKVVFPAPFGPNKPKMLFLGMSRWMSLSAWWSPYDLLIPLMLRMSKTG